MIRTVSIVAIKEQIKTHKNIKPVNPVRSTEGIDYLLASPSRAVLELSQKPFG